MSTLCLSEKLHIRIGEEDERERGEIVGSRTI